ncbi:transposase [Streptomyces brasiliensis]|uniref:Integrase catalytic domain-containing protein n=1 Tax=Streptomyces brasiliensis TaxID=1954 RepID=A0A917KZJ0_9ACTN|nr:hypothetical protein GCM10010121_052580 [Streptomyces brasiliensis]
MPAPRKHPDELRERAIREVQTSGRPVAPVPRDLGIHKEALRQWGRRAETLNGIFNAEPIEHQGPWRDTDQVEHAVFQWVGWYNTERLHSALDSYHPRSPRPGTTEPWPLRKQPGSSPLCRIRHLDVCRGSRVVSCRARGRLSYGPC